MRFARRAGTTAGVLAAVTALAGCGTTNGNLLTQGAAKQLSAELSQASSALSQYNCQVAYTALTNFRNDVGQLQGVNTTLVQMLSDGASRIDQLAGDRCPTGASTTTTGTSTSTKPARTSTTVTTVTPTTTTDTETSTSVTSTDSSGGGALTTTVQTSPPVTTPPVTSVPTPTTSTQESGGAGFGGASGGTGVGQ